VNLGLFFRAALGYCFNACGGHIHRRSNNGTPTFTVVETATSAMAMTVHALSGKTHSRKNIRDIQVRMSKPGVVKVAGGGTGIVLPVALCGFVSVYVSALRTYLWMLKFFVT
jgi:hypothetical protein